MIHEPACQASVCLSPKYSFCYATRSNFKHDVLDLCYEFRSNIARYLQMSVIALTAAVGASFCWALGALIAHRPAKLLGTFELTRTQLISSAALLLVVVTALDGWRSVTWAYWPAFVIASTIGVVLANLAMFACMRRGGPRRSQLLVSMNAPIAAVLGFVWLDEMPTLQSILGALLAFGGVLLAIIFGQRTDARFDAVDGSLTGIVALGLLAATCNAIGLIAIKPALSAGTDPLAATALRTSGGALLLSVIALWPAQIFNPITERTPEIVISAIIPGILGYVVAVTLQLYALRSMDTGIAAVLGSAAPVMMLPLIWMTARQRPPMTAWLGAILLLLGIGVIFDR